MMMDTANLWVPILMHFVANAFVQVLLHYQLQFADVEPTEAQLMLVGLGAMLALLVSLVSCLGLYRLRERQVVPEVAV
jgi:membrane protease YdiL (CAAX protease family)